MSLIKWFLLLGVAGLWMGCSVQPVEPTSLPTRVSPTRAPSIQLAETRTATIQPTLPAVNSPTATFTSTSSSSPTVTVPIIRENTPLPVTNPTISPATASQVAELARWGSGNAYDLAYSPDGSVLAVASSLGIYLYDDGYRLLDVIDSSYALVSLAFSPDGELLAAGNSDGKIELWQWRARKLVNSLDSGWHQSITHLIFSPSGTELGYTQENPITHGPAVQIIRTADGQPVFKGSHAGSDPFSFSPDGQSIFVSGSGVWQISITTGDFKDLANSNANDPIHTLAVSPDAKVFAAGGFSKVTLWKTGDAAPYHTFDTPQRTPSFLYHANTCRIAVDGGARTNISAMAFSPDGQLLAVGTADDTIQIRRANDGALFAASPSRNQPDQVEYGIEKIIFHPRQPAIIVLYRNGMIELRDSRNTALLQRIGGHTASFNSLAISPTFSAAHMFLAAGASDEIVRVWDLATGKHVFNFAGQADAVAFSPKGELLALGSNDWTVRWIRLFDGRLWGPLAGHQDKVESLSFFPDGKTLVSGSSDCTLKYWDAVTGAALKSIGSESAVQIGQIRQVLTSPDGKWLVILDGSGASWLVENPLVEGATLAPLALFNGVSSMALSPDGNLLAGVSYEKVILLNMDTRQQGANFKMSGSRLAFSPDGRLLAVGDEKGKIVLFNPENGQLLQTMQGHLNGILDLAFSPDGRFLASSSADGTVRVWGIP